MVETTTLHYGWTKPEISHSPSTWGVFLNTDLDSIDSLVWTNQQGIAPIGSITMFGGATAPTNWLICDGSSLSTAAPNDKLFAVLGTTYNQTGDAAGTFRLPNLQGMFPFGAGPSNALASTGGEKTVLLDQTMIPSHTHVLAMDPHNHQIADQVHTHADAGHTHQIPTVIGGTGIAAGSNFQLGLVASGTGSANIQGAATGITITRDAVATGHNYAVGGGLPHDNMPPYLAINFIIRAQ